MFDPSVTASYKVGIFGLPTTAEEARLHLLPVPWDATTSYGGGTSMGPDAILKASPQIDLFDAETGRAYEAGYHLLPSSSDIMALNQRLRPLALTIRDELENHGTLSSSGEQHLAAVNAGCEEMVKWVYDQTKSALKAGKLVGLIGGDHSSPEGAIRAVSESLKGEFGVLHFDAHADLREQYQGFKHSHASIMHNVMNAKWKPRKLVQVGIRDFCVEEYDLIQSREDIHTFFDSAIKNELFAGTAWSLICRQVVEALPKNVYISFDIDGLSPEFCPSTGTPVPGGLSYDQAVYLIGAVVKSGRRIVGFDLNEVAPGETEWDGNVGARLLYKLCGWTVVSQKQGS